MTAVLMYFLGISIYFLCDIVPGKIDLVLILGFGVFVMGYFVLPQINVHKSLMELKRKRTRALVEQIDKTFDIVAEDPAENNLARLRDLFDLQRVVNGKSSWSFGTEELLLLVGSVLLPLILFVLQYVVGRAGSQ